MTPDNVIDVDLDWTSTGIWVRGANASYDYCDIPDWLVARFEYWTWWYNRWEPWADADGRAERRKPDEELFDAYGLSLAIDLQRVLGPAWEVRYFKKDKLATKIPHPKCIEELWDHMPADRHPRSDGWKQFVPIHTDIQPNHPLHRMAARARRSVRRKPGSGRHR